MKNVCAKTTFKNKVKLNIKDQSIFYLKVLRNDCMGTELATINFLFTSET